jgi:hypothetical protein
MELPIMLYNTRTYNTDRILPDSVSYAGPAHTFSTADKVELKRVLPKPAGAFKGVARPTIKRTVAVVIDTVTGEKANAIVEISASLPVGMAGADVTALLADTASFVASTDAANLFSKLDVNA